MADGDLRTVRSMSPILVGVVGWVALAVSSAFPATLGSTLVVILVAILVHAVAIVAVTIIILTRSDFAARVGMDVRSSLLALVVSALLLLLAIPSSRSITRTLRSNTAEAASALVAELEGKRQVDGEYPATWPLTPRTMRTYPLTYRRTEEGFSLRMPAPEGDYCVWFSASQRDVRDLDSWFCG